MGIYHDRRENRRKILESLGLNPDDEAEFWLKYTGHVGGAHKRGLQALPDFTDYLNQAILAGITNPSQIGQAPDQYHLSRKGDTGDYTTESCRFILSNQNRQEAYENGRHESGNTRRSELMLGRTKETHPHLAVLSEKRRGLTKENCEFVARMAENKRGRTKNNDPGVASHADKMSKSFKIIDPNGNIHEGRNLREFCHLHNLNQSHMSAVCRGVKLDHKGWTGRYLD